MNKSYPITPAQLWALHAIARGYADSPSDLGQAMMTRPGAVPEGRGGTPYKAQGYGRMGGPMMRRLERAGLAILSHSHLGQWHPTRAQVSRRGQRVLAGSAVPDGLEAALPCR